MTNVPVESFAEWRAHARTLLRTAQPPEQVQFVANTAGQQALPIDHAETPTNKPPHARVPPEFLSLAETVSHHRDPNRWNLLYQILWRQTHGEPFLLKDHADPQKRLLRLYEKAIRRDLHKMRAFVRFRKTTNETYVAWFRPEHLIVRANAPFFVRRFGSMRWAILTPDASAYWDLQELRFGPAVPRDAAPPDDQIETLWLTYYSSI
jgi:DNA polymerase